jgi:small subunit ribosomal protein S12e
LLRRQLLAPSFTPQLRMRSPGPPQGVSATHLASLCVLSSTLRAAATSGRLARGLKASTKAISRDNASFCVLSSSCTDPAYVGHITKLYSARGIPLYSGVDSATLGSWAGLGTLDANGAARAVNKMVSCSCVDVKAPDTLLDTHRPRLISTHSSILIAASSPMTRLLASSPTMQWARQSPLGLTPTVPTHSRY